MKYKQFLQLVVMLLLLASCKKNLDAAVSSKTEKQNVHTLPLDKQYSYVSENLKTIATQLAIAIKNPLIKSQVRSEASKKFDGDYNVLLRNVFSIKSLEGNYDRNAVNTAFEAFEQIEGSNYYPQVYIPSCIQKRDPNSRRSSELSTIQERQVESGKTEFVIYDGNEDQQIFPAYILGVDNQLQLNGVLVDENYAIEHDVWVISLNENVDNNGELEPIDNIDPTPTPVNNNPILGIPPPPINPNLINVKIENIGINCLNESWAAGKADVSIRASRSTWNGRQDGQSNGAIAEYNCDRSSDDPRGILIRQFFRDETINGTTLQIQYVNFNLQSNWQIGNWNYHPITYYYVIFERDNWPAKIRVKDVTPFFAHFPNDYRLMQYRSSDDCYIAGSFYASRNGWPTSLSRPNMEFYNDQTIRQVIEQNSCIKLNITQY